MNKNIATDVHVVPHFHWDREWYFTTEESRILLVNNMEEIMEMLETNKDYPYYVLDGQTAILEDYFDVKPENKERVKKLIAEGRLIAGPWYTQTDEMVVGAESITRNLLYGLKDCKELTDVEPMMIGYLPDSFGQSEKLPQILNGFNINRAMFWRGASERHGTTSNNFYWKSNSEGEVLTHLLPLGYAIGKYLPVEINALEKRMSKYMPVLERGAVNETITLPNGHDQMPIQKDIFEVIESLKEIYPDKDFFLSKYENIFESIESFAKDNKLDTIQGELLDGKYMRVHRSIFSTRADLKSSNTRIENKLTNILEPLASIANSFGVPYEHGLIEAIWKEIMKNHAHDSIGCCCSDKVHKAIENRFFLAEDKADELIKFYKRKIADAISCEITLDKFVAYNLLPYDRTEVVSGKLITKMKNFKLVDEHGTSYDFELLHKEVIDAGLIDRQLVHYGDYDPFVEYTIAVKDTIPAMGYKSYLIQEIEGELKVNSQDNQDNQVENDFYIITVEPNGTLNIKDKITNSEYKNILLLEDGSDDGDEYDFSPLADDFILTSKDVKANININSFNNLSKINISFTMQVPKDLESRKAKKVDGTTDIEYNIVVKKNSKIIELEVIIDNKALDHRIRLLLPSGVASKFSVSDNQFGVIKRAVVDDMMSVWEQEGWDERPDSIYPMLSYVGLDNNQGLAVLTNSVREFEIIGDEFDTLAITLFRGIGFLGKEEMLRRPGRPSGIKMATPDSQMLGKQVYNLAITSNCKEVASLAKEYTTPIIHYNKMPYNAMKLNQPTFTAPYNYSLVKVDNKAFITTAFKKAEASDGYVLRGYQVEEENLDLSIAVLGDKKVTAQLNLNEEVLSSNIDGKNLQVPKDCVRSYYIK